MRPEYFLQHFNLTKSKKEQNELPPKASGLKRVSFPQLKGIFIDSHLQDSIY